MDSITNQFVSEGNASADLQIDFPVKVQYIEIINDSGTASLSYKFNASETYATLKSLEVVNVPIRSKLVIISGTGAYRIRAYG